MKPQAFLKIIFVLISLLILNGATFAGKVSKETKTYIRETIKEQISKPGYFNLKENSCCADIIFTIDSEGKILIKRMLSDDEALSDYLKERLGEISFRELENPANQHYRIKLSFRLV